MESFLQLPQEQERQDEEIAREKANDLKELILLLLKVKEMQEPKKSRFKEHILIGNVKMALYLTIIEEYVL